MKRILYFSLLVLTASLLSCGDGIHARRSIGQQDGTNLDETANIKMECVDVTDYKEFEDVDYIDDNTEKNVAVSSKAGIGAIASGIDYDPNTPPRWEDLNRSAADIMRTIMEQNGGSASNGNNNPPPKPHIIRDCIKHELEDLRECGKACEGYIGNNSYALGRERFQKKPKKDEVEIIDFISCDQIKEAECLLTND